MSNSSSDIPVASPNQSANSAKDSTMLSRIRDSISSISSPERNVTTDNQGAARTAGNTEKETKPTMFERFMNTVSLRPKDSGAEFPPPHWKDVPQSTEEAERVNEDPSSLAEASQSQPGSDKLDTIAEVPEFEDNVPPAQAPEPESFAHRIHAMLLTIPPVFSSTPTTSSAAASATSDSSGTSESPNMINDPKMISFLSSPSVMNGSSVKGRQSVWSVLDRLKGKLPASVDRAPREDDGMPMGDVAKATAGENVAGSKAREEEPEEDDDSSIMLYGPLFPNADSKVELAESEVVHDGEAEGTDNQDEAERKKGKSTGTWPFSGRKDKPAVEGEDGRVHLRKSKDKRVWLPSDSKISLEIMWWGYRLYLPPPVLNMLDNKQLEGAKRAAMVTTALKWLLDHVPKLMIPPNMRPATMLLKALIPYLGYVGGFVAWSWVYIKKFDKGNGVTLTATWLATVALVPGTWEDSDFPKRRHTDTNSVPQQAGVNEEGAKSQDGENKRGEKSTPVATLSASSTPVR
ncbi:hypothetical protein EIP91_004044 [Steccherinum ochraceum]|uniref:Uncharacterized protein n=1 Tax=Steccherinum ochraceum TaxID=92696 RepID=A0A4R0RCR9_9APHY|nr:hypothetical protein EIP91_004044 [Steccherinum ochraceum]